MKTHADKSPETQCQAAAHAAVQKQDGSNTDLQFIDNREEAADLRQLQEVADNSPQAQGLAQLSAMMNNGHRSAVMQNLHAMVDNSPRQVAQRQQHSRVQSAPMGLQAGSGNVSVQRVEDEELLQGKFTAGSPVQLAQQPDVKPNNTGLPDNLKSGIESLSGMSLDNVKVHYNSSEPAQLNAHAYAQGTDIHLGPGQEKHLPHEAWHVVQQAQGRVKPTMQMKDGVNVNDDNGLEKEADVMGAKALQIKPIDKQSSAVFNSVAQKKSVVKRGLGFIDNRPEAVAQRKLQEMVNNSPQVAQLAYDASVKRGEFNMVGENHDKTEEQREKEKFAAAESDLFYYNENELFTLKDGLNDKKADPTNLRILFALAKIKEAIDSIVFKKNQGVENERKTIMYVIKAVEGDIEDFKNERLKKSYLNLQYYIFEENVNKSLETIQDMVFEVDHRRLGYSEGLAVGRSEAMHEAANAGHTRRIMWMVGFKHTDDIDSIYGSNRDYTMLKQEALDKLIS